MERGGGWDGGVGVDGLSILGSLSGVRISMDSKGLSLDKFFVERLWLTRLAGAESSLIYAGNCSDFGELTMRIEGSNIISRPTQQAARRLTVIASTVIVLTWYEIDLGDLSVLGVSGFPDELFITVAFALLSFTAATLGLHWNGDRLSYSRWYHNNEVVRTGWGGTHLTKNHPETIRTALDAIEEKLLGEAADRTKEKNKFDSVYEYFGHLKGSLDQQRTDLRNLSWFAWFLLWIWYLMLPFALAVAAGLMLFCQG